MKKTIFPILALILVACASAPQVTVTSEVTVTSTPPPTETPLPTLTPTPVAVDGIAENAEGDKLAFLNGEWTLLPELDADYASMRMDENGGVVAVDAEGEIAFEYDMAANNWVEVVREPVKSVMAPNEKMKRAIEALPFPSDYVGLTYNDGQNTPVDMGYVGRAGDGSEAFSGVVLGVFEQDDYDAKWKPGVYAVVLGMKLSNGDEVRVALTIQPNPVTLMQENVSSSIWTDTSNKTLKQANGIYAENDEEKLAMFLKANAVGEQVYFTVNSGGDNTEPLKELMKLVKGEQANPDESFNMKLFQLGVVWMMDPSNP